MGSFNYFSYTIQIGLNWYVDTSVGDLEVAFLRLILCSKDLSNRPIYTVLNTHNLDMIYADSNEYGQNCLE